MTLIETIQAIILRKHGPVHIRELYAEMPEALKYSIRARVYENLGRLFKRVGRGIYVAVQGEASCVVVEGDAWKEVQKIPSGIVDALVTDPPYDWLDPVNKIHTTTRLRMRWDFERREIDKDLGLELHRVLRKGAHAFFFAPAESATTRPKIDRFIRLLESCGFVFNKKWIWDKQILGMGYNGRARHELILFLSKGRRRKPCDLSVPDVLSCRPIDSRLRKHPCEKPRSLVESIVKFATKAGELVLDCFAGSCSTGLAALGLGRDSILIEKNVLCLSF